MKGDLKRTLWSRAARAVGRAARSRAAAHAGRRHPPRHDAQTAVRVRPPAARPAPGAERRGPMQIHRVRGRDLVDALERAARQHGAHALVLSREPAPGGGVTVAVGLQARPLARVGARRRAAGRGPGRRRAAAAPLRAPPRPSCVARSRRVERSGARSLRDRRGGRGRSGRCVAVAPSPRVRGARRAASPRDRLRRTDRRRQDDHAGQAGRAAGAGAAGASRWSRPGRALDRRPRPARGLRRAAAGARASAPRTVAAWRARWRASRNVDAVLVDTSGRSPRDVEALGRLARGAGPGARGRPRAPGPRRLPDR